MTTILRTYGVTFSNKNSPSDCFCENVRMDKTSLGHSHGFLLPFRQAQGHKNLIRSTPTRWFISFTSLRRRLRTTSVRVLACVTFSNKNSPSDCFCENVRMDKTSLGHSHGFLLPFRQAQGHKNLIRSTPTRWFISFTSLRRRLRTTSVRVLACVTFSNKNSPSDCFCENVRMDKTSLGHSHGFLLPFRQAQGHKNLIRSTPTRWFISFTSLRRRLRTTSVRVLACVTFSNKNSPSDCFCENVRMPRLELGTSSLSVMRSNHLSYTRLYV